MCFRLRRSDTVQTPPAKFPVAVPLSKPFLDTSKIEAFDGKNCRH
ncbi:uncharacterized protein G2W53_033853 [Senna tora]|uniref:Uncharacterized protein n=1 Tax=Senna tora TaxID=362788 RepID=A0A834T0W6_9FABA|nr:uncharacterized protein G2W53_033853 [Senna tora]